MKKNRATADIVSDDALESIKQTAIVAMFRDDELMDHLVLKGGNAMDIIYAVNARGSVDLDFSLRGDLDIAGAQSKIERALKITFELEGYLAFDIKVSARPNKMPVELAAFWGGYLIEFKLIALKRAKDVDLDIDTMRREAIKLGKGPTFEIDISRHEYTADTQQHELLGYRIYVYSPEMIVCEKLRAICQQMPEYAQVIQRNGLGNQRARDFIDIKALVEKFGIDVGSDRAKYVVRQMFEIKRVPLELISKISTTRDLHALGFDEVRAAMKPGVKLEPFDYYFDFVVGQCKKLEPLGHV